MSGEYITAAEAARIFGLNPDYAARLAKRAAGKGEWPIKKRGTWLAPVSAWEKIFHPEQMKIRKKRTTKKIRNGSNKGKNLLTAKEFSERIGYSYSWVSELGRRSKQAGHVWPKKIGNMSLAPFEEWEYIVLTDKFKKRTIKRC